MDTNEEKNKARLEYLRGELRAERLSYGELAELQCLADSIDPGDVELLEAAGVPESAPRARHTAGQTTRFDEPATWENNWHDTGDPGADAQKRT